jgi:hypothetical protein
LTKEASNSATVCWGFGTIDISKEAFSSAIKYGIVALSMFQKKPSTVLQSGRAVTLKLLLTRKPPNSAAMCWDWDTVNVSKEAFNRAKRH